MVLKYGISYHDREEMMLELGLEVDHTTESIYGPIPFARPSLSKPRERLLPYIRPVDEEIAPLALMEYARLVLSIKSASKGPILSTGFQGAGPAYLVINVTVPLQSL